MSKFLNRPDDALAESLAGFARAHAELIALNDNPRFVRRRDPSRSKVALVAGGGSGHEPLHHGFVGRGMLDAAVPGEVFTSPSPEQILAATEAVAGPPGTLFLVKNYSGDVMNFELAGELHAGPSRQVLIEDDVGLGDTVRGVGRRGVAGTLVVEKLAGAAAEQGADLAACAAIGDEAARSTRSMGVALGGCRVPTADEANLALAAGEMEIGVGIHGEPGRSRTALASADAIVDELCGAVANDLGVARGDPVLLFVNGFGGTPLMELSILYGAAARLLDDRGVVVARSLVGSYVTSLEMPGASLTLTRLSDRLVTLWDAPVLTPALRWRL